MDNFKKQSELIFKQSRIECILTESWINSLKEKEREKEVIHENDFGQCYLLNLMQKERKTIKSVFFIVLQKKTA